MYDCNGPIKTILLRTNCKIRDKTLLLNGTDSGIAAQTVQDSAVTILGVFPEINSAVFVHFHRQSLVEQNRIPFLIITPVILKIGTIKSSETQQLKQQQQKPPRPRHRHLLPARNRYE